MYFSYGFPRSYNIGTEDLASDIVYTSFGGDVLVLVTNTLIQLWSGGHHRVKLGEISRPLESLKEHGDIIKACWCPGRRILAAAVRFYVFCMPLSIDQRDHNSYCT